MKTMLLCCLPFLLSAAVSAQRLPDGEVQPRLVQEDDGTVHLISVVGDVAAARIRYRRLAAGDPLGEGRSVNDDATPALAIGTVRGPQIAIGGGVPHVVWMGGNEASPRGTGGGTPLLYSRRTEDGFSEAVLLSQGTVHLDGGLAVAAAGERVWVAWHANAPGSEGESERAMYLRSSTDGGASFAPARVVSQPDTGACACCGMAMAATDAGPVILFRSAEQEGTARDTTLIIATGEGDRQTKLDPWRISGCMMSGCAVVPAGGDLLLSWQTRGDVIATTLDAGVRPGTRLTAPGGADKKHGQVARSDDGQLCLAWTEGTAWKRGGSVCWQVFGADGSPRQEARGRRADLPAWSLPAVARRDGGFVIYY